MATNELLAVFYFVALAVLAPATAVSRRRQTAVAVLAALVAAAIVAASWTFDGRVSAWLPHAYLAAGYWIPALLTAVPVTPTGFERWLLGTEHRLRPLMPRLFSPLLPLVELAYLACYPLVPAAFAVIWIEGTPADVSRFWTAVLGAGFACYGSLPWLISRPPRFAAPDGVPRSSISALNVAVLGRISHRLNTFPSGHVAVSLAAAGSLSPVSPVAALAVGSIAVAVAVGAVAGRYHFIVDVLMAVVVAGLALLLSFLVSPV